MTARRGRVPITDGRAMTTPIRDALLSDC